LPRCNADHYCLVFEVDSILDDLPFDNGKDLEVKGVADALSALDLLVENECRMRIERLPVEKGVQVCSSDHHPAFYDASTRLMYFYGMLANTGELSDRLGVRPDNIVRCIDAGELTGLHVPDSIYRLVVKDSRCESLTREEALSDKTYARSRKVKGRGLSRKVQDIISSGVLSGRSFGVKEVAAALSREGWREGRNYHSTSISSALRDLVYSGDLVLDVPSKGDVGSRRWSVRGSTTQTPQAVQVPQAGISSPQIGQIVNSLTDELADRLLEIAAAKAAARLSSQG